MKQNSNSVYVIISGDIDYSEHHHYHDKLAVFNEINSVAEDLDLKLSFYFTAKEAVKIENSIKKLANYGHEIGCHGLLHNDEEEYNKLPYKKQYACISEATSILSDIIDRKIYSFRAPRVKVSSQMYKVLGEIGYLTDSSICSQRVDFISSNMFNIDWLFAPRLPYNPDEDKPFKRGNSKILIVPISAMLVPFISSVLYVFGLEFMKLFFSVLYKESLRNGKPIVYLYHPYEFIPEIPGKKQYHSNIRVHGLRFRRHLYRGTPQEKLAKHIALWKYIKSFPTVEILTMSQFYERRVQEKWRLAN